MFLDFYNLREQPFAVTPDPKFLYLGATHSEAFATLVYSVECNRGFTALIATPGMGKTTLLFSLLKQFRDSARTAFLFHTKCNAVEFLRHLVSDLEVETDACDIVEMQQRLNKMLLNEAQKKRRVLVVIDEAQDLSDEVLESVRLLSNFETPDGKLIHFLLAGQPGLAKRLSDPTLAQLRQRISSVARLEPLMPQETTIYINHRLAVAGHTGENLFNPEARALIAAISGGIPRNINNLCFNALSIGFATRKRVIDGPIIREVAADLDIASLSAERPFFAAPAPCSVGGELAWQAQEANRTASSLASFPHAPKVSAPAREQLKQWSLTAALCSTALALLVWAMPGSANRTIWPTRPNRADIAPRSAASSNSDRESQPKEALLVSQFAKLPSAFRGGSVTSAAKIIQRTPSLATVNRPQAYRAEAFPISALKHDYQTGRRAAEAETRRHWNENNSDRDMKAIITLGAGSVLAHSTPYLSGESSTRDPKGQPVSFLDVNRPATEVTNEFQETPLTRSKNESGASLIPASFGASLSFDAPLTTYGIPGELGEFSTGISGKVPAFKFSAPRWAAAPNAVPNGLHHETSHLQEARVISQPAPVYPAAAGAASISGLVRMEAIIGKDGRVRTLKVISGDSFLTKAAIAAVSQWRYQPALLNGQPVEAATEIDVQVKPSGQVK